MNDLFVSIALQFEEDIRQIFNNELTKSRIDAATFQQFVKASPIPQDIWNHELDTLDTKLSTKISNEQKNRVISFLQSFNSNVTIQEVMDAIVSILLTAHFDFKFNQNCL